MSNNNHLFKLSSTIDNMLNSFSNNLVLNKLPLTDEISKLKQKPNTTLSYKVKDNDTAFIYQNGKAKKIGGNTKDSQLNFSDTKINNSINRNTNIVNEDFPGSFNLPVPNPSTLKYLGTGNGNGGEIFSRDQVKIAEQITPIEGRNVFSDSFGRPIKRRFAMSSRDAWDVLPNLAHKTRGLLPTGFMGEASKYSPKTSALVGSLALALAGLGAGGIYHYLTKNRRTDPYTNEQPSLIKDLLIGTGTGALGGGILGHALGKDMQNTKTASSFSDVATINNKIMGDTSLSFQQKRQLMNLINSLPSTSISQIAPMVGSLIGTGAGAIIAKYLMGMGITGTVLTSILGATIGSNIARRFAPLTPSFNPIQGMGFLDNFGQRI